MTRLSRSFALSALLIAMGCHPGAHAQWKVPPTLQPAAVADEAWNPIDGGFYDKGSETYDNFIRLFQWSGQRANSLDCSAPDRKRVSQHDVLGYRLGDLCLVAEENRQVIARTYQASIDTMVDRLREEAVANSNRIDATTFEALRVGIFGWSVEGIPAGNDGGTLTFGLVMFHTGPARTYIAGITRTFCAASPDNTLEPDSRFMRAMMAKYGKPDSSQTRNAKAQAEVEAQLELGRRLVALKEDTAVTGKSYAEIARHREKIKEIELMQKVATEKARAKGDPVIAYRWLYDNYHLDIEHVGECGNRVPKYKMELSPRGQKPNLFNDLDEANKKNLKTRLDARAAERRRNEPLPKF